MLSILDCFSQEPANPKKRGGKKAAAGGGSSNLAKTPTFNDLKKSRSGMIRKSKSTIMSAKDISMNAFMAIKSKADSMAEAAATAALDSAAGLDGAAPAAPSAAVGGAESQAENWLATFLSESLAVEDIPWECSKALIILKQGYQV